LWHWPRHCEDVETTDNGQCLHVAWIARNKRSGSCLVEPSASFVATFQWLLFPRGRPN
jgi:hypothetical protein